MSCTKLVILYLGLLCVLLVYVWNNFAAPRAVCIFGVIRNVVFLVARWVVMSRAILFNAEVNGASVVFVLILI